MITEEKTVQTEKANEKMLRERDEILSHKILSVENKISRQVERSIESVVKGITSVHELMMDKFMELFKKNVEEVSETVKGLNVIMGPVKQQQQRKIMEHIEATTAATTSDGTDSDNSGSVSVAIGAIDGPAKQQQQWTNEEQIEGEVIMSSAKNNNTMRANLSPKPKMRIQQLTTAIMANETKGVDDEYDSCSTKEPATSDGIVSENSEEEKGSSQKQDESGSENAILRPGDIVSIRGLVSQPMMNGCKGVLLSFHDEKKRWSVKIQLLNVWSCGTDEKIILLKPLNLEKGNDSTEQQKKNFKTLMSRKYLIK